MKTVTITLPQEQVDYLFDLALNSRRALSAPVLSPQENAQLQQLRQRTLSTLEVYRSQYVPKEF